MSRRGESSSYSRSHLSNDVEVKAMKRDTCVGFTGRAIYVRQELLGLFLESHPDMLLHPGTDDFLV